MHEEVCDAFTSSFQIRSHMIMYAVIAGICAIMTRENSCFNLAYIVIKLLISHLFASTLNYIVVAIINIIENRNNYTLEKYM